MFGLFLYNWCPSSVINKTNKYRDFEIILKEIAIKFAINSSNNHMEHYRL